MKKGFSRFSHYFEKVNDSMAKAAADKNPAMWLLSNDGRTPFFMLEGLARLYSKLHNKKTFEKKSQQFKAVEDLLGRIDYFEWLSSSLSKNKDVPDLCINYIRNKSAESASELNDILERKGWLDGKRMRKIEMKIKKTDWMKPDDEVKAVAAYYKKAIMDIDDFVIKTEYLFDNIEKDVHELRRRLRWLSIYPQAMQGMFRYAESRTAPAHLKKYLTPEIVNSPYNKLPAEGNNTCFVIVDKNNFLALSWMIAKLGSLKDEGLLVTGLSDALKNGAGYTGNLSLSEAYSRLNQPNGRIQQILDEAEAVTKTFIKERCLQHLVVKTTKKIKEPGTGKKVK
ncbi:MAG TPA: hypothetical protein VK155_14225 [Bacteroidales bacterium]|nr:hypothetical protein [Bacteroidales bacterium]